MSNPTRKQWNKPYLPIRNLILWGWDSQNNPSFLVLYGEHQYETLEDPTPASPTKPGLLGSLFKSLFNSPPEKVPPHNQPTQTTFLAEQVTYTHYMIFKGHQGHLPNFEAIKILDQDHQKKMYYKKGVTYRYAYYHTDKNSLVEDFKPLTLQPHFSYFTPPPYEFYVVQLEKQGLSFPDFTLAKHPNDFLQLSGEDFKYYPVVSQILSHPLLYMRKKYLKELLDLNPPDTLLHLLFNLGSSELIAGLCLELAKCKNHVLLEATKKLLETPIDFGSPSYTTGVLRCASIYINALDTTLKQERVQAIYKNLPYMDLPLIHLNDKPIPEGTCLSGAQYNAYAIQAGFQRSCWADKPELYETFKKRHPAPYQVGPYSDGYDLDFLAFKNTFQEAVSYDLADVIGKIAYYLDAPRLKYYFKSASKTKAYHYLVSSVRRVLDDYAKNRPDLFIEAMKTLLTSYTPGDYLCKFPGNFQFNYFIRYYLYHDFTEKPPTSWRHRYSWFKEDQLMKLTGRQEIMKELWDHHLEDVLYIAIHGQVPLIQKACYYILKEATATPKLVSSLSHKDLIELSQSAFPPLAALFTQYLNERLSRETTCELNLLLALMDTPYDSIRTLALRFMTQTNSTFTPHLLAECFLLEHANNWLETLQVQLLQLDTNQYTDFMIALSEKLVALGDHIPTLSTDLEDLLLVSISKVEAMTLASATKLMELIGHTLSVIPNLPPTFLNYFEGILFSFNEETLEALLKETPFIDGQLPVVKRQKQTLALLTSIQTQTLPSDSDFKQILEEGKAPMVKALLRLLEKLQSSLSSRPTLLLLMLESDLLILNHLGTKVFEGLSKENTLASHALIIDSPIPKVYHYGLKQLDQLYGDFIPKAFILQLLEHPSSEVKAYISDKMDTILKDLGEKDAELFMYYAKTLLLLPNKVSKSKDTIYQLLPTFIRKHPAFNIAIEAELLAIGGSNITCDSERALMSLAQIRKELTTYEG